MRQLPKRPSLSDSVSEKLAQETNLIRRSDDSQSEAERRYRNARQVQWFQAVIEELKKMSGVGERCMFCSGNESSDVEHFRPKSIFPELAFIWENLLWACTICNRAKLNRFPLELDKLLINPIEENVWEFFFIDEFGLLTPRWNKELNAQDPRAISTLEIVNLGRQALQQTRQRRLLNLKQQVADSLRALQRNELSKRKLRERIKTWRAEPFQPDVADYFLNGPGKAEKPFRKLFQSL